MKRLKLLLVLLLCFSIFSCEEKINPNETYKYDVWIVSKYKKKYYLGTVTGLSSCKYIANQKIKGDINTGWTYECCLVTKLSRCKEKHK